MTDYLIQLRPAPGCSIPDEVSLRRLLKRLGRSYALRCIDIREGAMTPATKKNAPAGELQAATGIVEERR
jgi:hypothetical protein